MQLTDSIYDELHGLAEQGNIAIDEGRFNEAIALWEQALTLLPKPVNQWQAAFWLYASMAEGYYQLDQFDESITHLVLAQACPESKENPYTYYLLGKCYWRLSHEQAAEYLLKAYDLDGEGIFSADTVDGKGCLQYLYDRSLL